MNHPRSRKVLLIAWSHFTAILQAKAFWLGVLMTPALIVAMITIIRYAENSQPTRYVAVIDSSGQYRQAISDAIAKTYVERALSDFAAYYAKYRNVGQNGALADSNKSTVALSPDAQRSKDILEQFIHGSKNIRTQPATAADVAALVEHSRALLRTNAPSYALPRQRFVLIETPPDLNARSNAADLASSIRSYVLGAKKVLSNGQQRSVDAIAIVEAAVTQPESRMLSAPRVQYWSANLADSALANLIENAVNQQLRQKRLLATGIDADSLAAIENAKVELTQFDAKKEQGNEGRTLADRISNLVPVIFAVVLFMVLMISVSILLQSIIEEKSNRLIEVLLSSVTSTQLMAGKLLGVAAVSLVSIAVWLGLAIAGAYFGFGAGAAAANAGSQALAASNVSPEQVAAVFGAIDTMLKLLPVFIFCFLCGYLIYASLFLAIGSLCSSPRDANTLVTPLIILMIVPIALIRFFITDPNGTIATVFTWIPLYTPFTIVVRMSAHPPVMEMVGSAIIMLLMTAVALWVAAKIFRFGVLYSGGTPKFLQIFGLVFGNKTAG